VLQPERVADFVRRELTQARDYDLLHELVDYSFVFAVRRD